jgi:hypothetical protein
VRCEARHQLTEPQGDEHSEAKGHAARAHQAMHRVGMGLVRPTTNPHPRGEFLDGMVMFTVSAPGNAQVTTALTPSSF